LLGNDKAGSSSFSRIVRAGWRAFLHTKRYRIVYCNILQYIAICVDDVMKRLQFFRDAFEELGFHGDDLEMRTRACAVFQTGERQILGPEKEASEKYRKARLQMLIGESKQ
jgi:hypothetical protein